MSSRSKALLALSLCTVLLFGCNGNRSGSATSLPSSSPSSTSTSTSTSTFVLGNVSNSKSVANSKSSNGQAEPKGNGSSNARPGSATSLLTEPQAGVAPWLNIISHAHSEILVNEYLLTYTTLTQALISASNRGVTVDVIVDGHPYNDSSALNQSESVFAGTKVDLKTAPLRFEGSYSFDHAKYIVVDPGRSDQVAVLGSPNGTASAFDGYNAEDAIQTSDPAIISALELLFEDDWQGHQAGSSPRQYLVLSPGSSSALTTLLSFNGPIEVTAEELGDAPAIYGAIESHGSQARVLLPSYLSYSELSYASELVRAGVQVRTIVSPYLHAKLIVTCTQTFVGSQNFSEPSLYNNREVGVITSDPKVRAQALSWFDTLWNDASTLNVQVSPTTTASTAVPTTTASTAVPTTTASIPAQTPTSSGSYPYIPYGDTAAQVESLWGQPTSTGTTTYDGYPEQVWFYQGGAVYFGSSGTVVYVQR